jgi:hypothetical protein
MNPGTRIIPVLLLTVVSGCHTLDSKPTHWPWTDRPTKGQIGQLVALWGDGLVVQPDALRGGSPTPGFAARLYLFGQEPGEPLGVDGALTVYLYDLQQPADQRRPLEVWNITPENLERIAKKDGLGWGYDLWLPWSTFKREITRVSLVVHYKPTQGMPVWSIPCDLLLGEPGGQLKQPAEVVTKSFRRDPRHGAVGK